MKYNPIIATLGFILSKDKKSVLMIHRNKRANDDHLGKYNGLGGKMKKNESVVDCMKREILEEAGINCTKLKLRGTINWTDFNKNGENWLGFIFLIEEYEGTVKEENEEGKLHWIKIEDIGKLPMWEGDKHFLPLVFDNNEKIFHGYMPYSGDKPLGWEYSRI